MTWEKALYDLPTSEVTGPKTFGVWAREQGVGIPTLNHLAQTEPKHPIAAAYTSLFHYEGSWHDTPKNWVLIQSVVVLQCPKGVRNTINEKWDSALEKGSWRMAEYHDKKILLLRVSIGTIYHSRTYIY